MSTVLLAIHIMVAASMIVIILLQRSEGGALGMGGGGGGGLVSSRGAANLLTRLTSILAAIFFTTSLTLGIIGHRTKPASTLGTGIQRPATEPGSTQDVPGALPDLKLRRPKASGDGATAAPTGAVPTPNGTAAPQAGPKPVEVPQSQ